MKGLILLPLLALLTIGLCRRAADRSGSAPDPPGSQAFISKRSSAEVVQRHRRSFPHGSPAQGAAGSPLEAQREVCELSPDCDELADQIGFQEAYRRLYGPV